MPERAAGLQHVEIFILKAAVRLLIDGIERIHEAIAERIGIDIEGRMDEMRDIAPEILILVMQPDRRAEAFALDIHPDFANLVRREFFFPPGIMQALLEFIKGDLTHHGVQHILDLARQHDLALGRIALFLQQGPEGELFAKDARGFGQRQRRIGEQAALRRRQQLMHPVAKLMGEGHHIADIALIVEQQIGMHARHRRMGEGAWRLAGAHTCINPRFFKELLPQRRQIRRETAIGLKHGITCLAPGNDPIIGIGKRRVAVPIVDLVLAHPFRLDRVITMGQARIGALYGLGQRIDNLGLDLIGEMAHSGRLRRAAPVILDRLVLGQRVGNQREQPDILPEHLAEILCCLLAQFRIRAGKKVQHLLRGHFLAIHLEFEARHGLIEQPHPGAPSGDILLMQQLLDLVGELIGFQRPHVIEPGLVFLQAAALIHRLKPVILDRVQFQREEQKVGTDGTDLLLHGLEELANIRVRHIARIDEIGIGHDPALDLADLLELGDGEIEPLPVQLGQLALVLRGEGLGILRRRFQILAQFGRGPGRVQIAQVPFGQIGKGGISHVKQTPAAINCSCTFRTFPSTDKEIGMGGGNRPVPVLLPGLDPHVGDPAAGLGHYRLGIGFDRLAGAEIFDRDIDDLRQARHLLRRKQMHQRGAFQKCADDPAMQRRQGRVADEFLILGQDADEPSVGSLQPQPQISEIGNHLENGAPVAALLGLLDPGDEIFGGHGRHDFVLFSSAASFNVLPVVDFSMKVPTALAIGSSGSL